MSQFTRRKFLQQSATAGLALAATGYWTQAAPAARRSALERLTLAAIGVGNRGAVNLTGLKDEQVIALCDVDERYLSEASERFPEARTYRDFRELLEQESPDGVIVSTPDHTHFHSVMEAIRRGRHVYCEKPLAHSLSEVQQMREAAERTGVITQMGNQHHSSPGYRLAVEWIRSKKLGTITEVHSWTNRPLWPQGISRPAEAPAVPDYLHWDLWLGPAPERPYHDTYHPLHWRGWLDFGTGALGDMGPHLLDVVFWGLELESPTHVEAVRRDDSPTAARGETYPRASIVRWTFPARDGQAAVQIVWYDGGQKPPAEITGTNEPPSNGTLFIGERAKLFVPELGGRPIVIPRGKERLTAPEPFLPIVDDHYRDWTEAIRRGEQPSSSFAYAAPLTATCLLGNIALRVEQPLEWNAAEGRFVNCPAADALLGREYREWGERG